MRSTHHHPSPPITTHHHPSPLFRTTVALHLPNLALLYPSASPQFLCTYCLLVLVHAMPCHPMDTTSCQILKTAALVAAQSTGYRPATSGTGTGYFR
ncbi:hypothetical protein CLOP_g16766 [Closterium sp. NIES-67]|nr:hypothetical protein CLOP_g16766 [Closterium sp. NIES-67]